MTLGNTNLSSGTDEEERAAVIAFLGGGQSAIPRFAVARQLSEANFPGRTRRVRPENMPL